MKANRYEAALKELTQHEVREGDLVDLLPQNGKITDSEKDFYHCIQVSKHNLALEERYIQIGKVKKFRKQVFEAVSKSAAGRGLVVYHNPDLKKAPEAAKDVTPANDDITSINGIGNSAAAKLKAYGYTDFKSLADSSVEELEKIEGLPKSANLSSWIEQAKERV